jgi:8-oxo-dGTP pyrophosphatase MutT (NUDIX family)
MEPRETDLQCALRELYEETGITPSVKSSSFRKFGAGGYYFFHLDNEPTPQVHAIQEISEAKWFELSEIKQLNCNLDLNTFARWMRKMPRPSTETDENPSAVCA